MKNDFKKDPLLGLKISKKSFENNPNSKKWNFDSQGRYLSSYCSKESHYQDLNLIISGGSTSFPLGTVHSGINSTWIDLLLKRKELNKYCVNTISIAFPGFNIKKELKALQYLLKNNSSFFNKKTILISLSGINEIENYSRKLYYPKNNSYIFPYTKKLIFKIKRISRYLFNLYDLKNKNANDLIENGDEFLSEKDIYTNASNWKLNLERINRISIDNQIEFIQILQPTLGLKSDPNILKERILKIKNPIRAALLANIFKKGYFPGINKLYESLSENCLEIEFCIDGSKDKKLLLLNSNTDLYSDYRHPNVHGNKILAEYIFTKVIERL